jgi:hypothetical protein
MIAVPASPPDKIEKKQLVTIGENNVFDSFND